jgi:hypothetical protein
MVQHFCQGLGSTPAVAETFKECIGFFEAVSGYEEVSQRQEALLVLGSVLECFPQEVFCLVPATQEDEAAPKAGGKLGDAEAYRADEEVAGALLVLCRAEALVERGSVLPAVESVGCISGDAEGKALGGIAAEHIAGSLERFVEALQGECCLRLPAANLVPQR